MSGADERSTANILVVLNALRNLCDAESERTANRMKVLLEKEGLLQNCNTATEERLQ